MSSARAPVLVPQPKTEPVAQVSVPVPAAEPMRGARILLECLLQWRSQHGTIFHVANTVRSSLKVAKKFFVSRNLPTGARTVAPLVG